MIQELSDTRNFKKFYEEHFVSLMRYSTSIVKETEAARDIVQQAFISLWQKRADIGIHTSAKAYLYKAVYNSSFQLLQQRKKRNLREQWVASRHTNIPAVDSATERELERRIQNAIDGLPEQCRRIFAMSRNENLKYKEIAAQLNLSEKTVENQMCKALKLLRTALQEYLPVFLLLTYLCHA